MKGGENMIKTLRWIVLVWTIIAIPYMQFNTFSDFFYGIVYVGLILGVVIYDLVKENKKN